MQKTQSLISTGNLNQTIGLIVYPISEVVQYRPQQQQPFSREISCFSSTVHTNFWVVPFLTTQYILYCGYMEKQEMEVKQNRNRNKNAPNTGTMFSSQIHELCALPGKDARLAKSEIKNWRQGDLWDTYKPTCASCQDYIS